MPEVRPDKIHSIIWRVFTKNNGLTLKAEVAEYLKTRLSANFLTEQQLINALNYIATEYKRTPRRPQLVDIESLSAVIEDMVKMNVSDGVHNGMSAKSFVHVMDVTDCPRWDYDPHQKSFYRVKNDGWSSIGRGAESKIGMQRRHFNILKQRVLRSREFGGPKGNKLSSIKSIKGQNLGEKKLLFGMLSQMEEGAVFLEDLEDFIKLDISRTENILPAMYTETSMAIVGGVPEGKIFKVESISPPPLESRSQSITTLSHPNYSIDLMDSIGKLKHIEANHSNSFLVIVSDLWLDCPRTMSKFALLLARLVQSDNTIPAAFILQGSFLSASPPPGISTVVNLQNSLGSLADVIMQFPILVEHSRFFIQPSLDDPLLPRLLPRMAGSRKILLPFQSTPIDISLLSNPSRLFFFTKEIFVMRNDLRTKLQHGLVKGLETYSDNNLMKAIFEQAHCCPLPLSVQLRSWEYDHALCLYPLPDLVIVSERSRPSTEELMGCVGINAGSFATSEFSFSIVYPLLDKVEQW